MAPRGSHLLAELARAESAREPADGGGGNGSGGGGVDEVAGEPLVGRLAAVAAVKVKNGETREGRTGLTVAPAAAVCRGGSPGLWGGDGRRLHLATSLKTFLTASPAAGG